MVKPLANVAHPEDLWKICIIHDVDRIFSRSGSLFGDVNNGYSVLKTRILSLSEQFVFFPPLSTSTARQEDVP